MLCSSIIASLLLLPYEFRDFGKSVWAAAMFASNVLFWRQSGYFDAPAESKPLLHTWSLAVEEQLYVFFPLFLLLVYRWRGHRLTLALLQCALASLALSIWGAARRTDRPPFISRHPALGSCCWARCWRRGRCRPFAGQRCARYCRCSASP